MSKLELVQETNVMTASPDSALGWALNVNSSYEALAFNRHNRPKVSYLTTIFLSSTYAVGEDRSHCSGFDWNICIFSRVISS